MIDEKQKPVEIIGFSLVAWQSQFVAAVRYRVVAMCPAH